MSNLKSAATVQGTKFRPDGECCMREVHPACVRIAHREGQGELDSCAKTRRHPGCLRSIRIMQLRMLLRPTVLPFLRVRGSNATQPRRSGLFNAKSQVNGRSPAAQRGRRFAT